MKSGIWRMNTVGIMNRSFNFLFLVPYRPSNAKFQHFRSNRLWGKSRVWGRDNPMKWHGNLREKPAMKSNEAGASFLGTLKAGFRELRFHCFVYLAFRQKFYSWQTAGDSLLDGKTSNPHPGNGLRREGFLKSCKSYRRNPDGKEIPVRRGKDKTFNVGVPNTIGQFKGHIVGLQGIILRSKLLECAFDNILGHARRNAWNPLRHAWKIPMAIAGRSLRHPPRDTFDEKWQNS